MSERLDKVRELPLHIYLGAEEITTELGNGRIRAIVNKNAVNPAGMLHGGTLYTLSDVCAYVGLLSILTSEQEAVTHDIHVSVMRPARLHDEVIYTSRLVKMGKSLCFIDVKAESKDQVIATARVTKSIVNL